MAQTITQLVLDRDVEGALALAGRIAELQGKVTVHGATIAWDGSELTTDGVLRQITRGMSEDLRNVGAGKAEGANSIQFAIMSLSGQERDDEFRSWAEYAGYTGSMPVDPDGWKVFTAACVLALGREKLAELYAGTVKAGGGGPRRSAEEVAREDVAMAMLLDMVDDADKTALKAMKVRDRRPLLSKVYEANKESIDAEVARRLAPPKAAVKVTLKDLIGA